MVLASELTMKHYSILYVINLEYDVDICHAWWQWLVHLPYWVRWLLPAIQKNMDG